MFKRKLLTILGDSRKRRHLIIAIIIFAVAEVLMGNFYRFGGEHSYLNIGPAKFAFFNIPFMLLTGLYGMVPSAFMVLGLFIYGALTTIQKAYLFFPYLVVALAVFLPARFRWYRKPFLVILEVAILSFLLGNGYFFAITFANPMGVYYISAFGQLCLFLSELPECFIAVMLLWIFYTKTAEDVRADFYCSRYYTADYEARLAVGKEEKESILKLNVLMFSICMITIIVITSIVITMRLFDLYAVSANSGENSILTSDTDVTRWKQQAFQDILEGTREAKAKDENAVTIPEFRFINQVHASYSTGMPLAITSRSMLRQLSMMLILVIVPLLIINNWILQEYIVVPVTNLESFMVGYVATPETERREYIRKAPDITPPYHNELYRLHNALATLVNDVENYVSTIQHQRTVEDNLRIQRLAAEAKSTFLINMSNQIRTPISSIMGMNTMIMNTTHEVETKAFSQDIRNSAKALMGVVNDILDYAKIQSGSVEIIPVQYDLRTTIRTVHDMVHSIAEEKELELRYEIDENLPSMLYGDEIRIRQCLLNLMSNAVKYTKHGKVSFSIRCEKQGAQDVFLRFIIRDTGIGMSEEQIQRLMHAKVVADSEDALSNGEYIGTSIVNYLLDSMGSQLHVHSTLGEGTEVSFRLLQRVINWNPGDSFDVKQKSV